MQVEPKALVRRLTPTTTRYLEAAVARASARQSHEITVEHLLAVMLEDEGGDAAALLVQVGVDRARLLGRVERTLQGLRAGNAGRPVFSETLFQWVEDAWLVASVELGAQALRSGVLLARLFERPSRYVAEPYPELDGERRAAVRGRLAELLEGLPEALEAAPPAASRAGEAPAGGTGALERFASAITQKARAGEIDPIFGRDREVRQMVDILLRRRKNNPLIVGEPGVGKTALVEGLALAIARQEVPASLQDVEVYGLDLGALQAGAGVKGEFESRLKAVLHEVKSSPRPIILFIDEAHTLIGAGGAQGGSDAANLLKPALARGELRTIAATTWSEYKKYFEKDAALERRFQPVPVEEPSEEGAVAMLRGLAPVYEKAHGVVIRDEAVTAAVRLSQRFLPGRQLPDKAVDLLDTAAARVKLELSARPEALVQLEARTAALERTRAALTRDTAEGAPVEAGALEAVAHQLGTAADERARLLKRWEDERGAVEQLHKAQAALAARPEGADEAQLRAELSRAKAALAALQGEDPLMHTEVTPDVVARVISTWTGIPAGRMRTDALTEALRLEKTLRTRVRGQDEALRTVAEVVHMGYAGIRNPTTPVGVLLFVGPSGVGKTETATALADALYGGERFMTVINMSEFQEKHSVSRLVGSPPGYVGYGEGGVLTEAVRQRPYSVVLLDECEKADLEVMNLFYQVFDKGTLNDGEGRAIDFRNTLVILTSNLATEQLMELHRNGSHSTDEVVAAIRPALSRHFRPALLARMTVVPFAPVGGEVLKDIVRLKLEGLAQRLQSSHRVETRFAPALVSALAERCTDPESGARNVDHILRGSLMPALAKQILERMLVGALPRTLEIGVEGTGGWCFGFGP